MTKRPLLSWTKTVQKILREKVFDPDIKVKRGLNCIFISLTSTTAAKIYFSRANRDYSVKEQKRAFESRIAPCAGDSFDLSYLSVFHANGSLDYVGMRKIYGYLTEIAAPHRGIKKLEFENLKDIVSSLGLEHRDMRAVNLGRIQGRLVLIDFDKASHKDFCGESEE